MCFISSGLGVFVGEQRRTVRKIRVEPSNLFDKRVNFKKELKRIRAADINSCVRGISDFEVFDLIV